VKTVKGEGRKSAEPAVKYVLSEEHGLEVIFHQAANISEPSSSVWRIVQAAVHLYR